MVERRLLVVWRMWEKLGATMSFGGRVALVQCTVMDVVERARAGAAVPTSGTYHLCVLIV
mgnify:CR=1 FL=1